MLPSKLVPFLSRNGRRRRIRTALPPAGARRGAPARASPRRACPRSSARWQRQHGRRSPQPTASTASRPAGPPTPTATALGHARAADPHRSLQRRHRRRRRRRTATSTCPRSTTTRGAALPGQAALPEPARPDRRQHRPRQRRPDAGRRVRRAGCATADSKLPAQLYSDGTQNTGGVQAVPAGKAFLDLNGDGTHRRRARRRQRRPEQLGRGPRPDGPSSGGDRSTRRRSPTRRRTRASTGSISDSDGDGVPDGARRPGPRRLEQHPGDGGRPAAEAGAPPTCSGLAPRHLDPALQPLPAELALAVLLQAPAPRRTSPSRRSTTKTFVPAAVTALRRDTEPQLHWPVDW